MAETTQERLQFRLVDRYRIERELGRGGMATVFLAQDLKHDREVAIKVLHPELAASIGGDRFEREIKLAAKLQHPHILGLFDSGNADGLLYYVMPFVVGESVRDRLDREGQLPVPDAIQITLEVADALGHAHKLGIIHRDIKPENILLSAGHALVADFGIASAATEGTEKLTQTGMAVGTPAYMSPEQAAGGHVGPSADLYSLGCVLYEMLSGEPPFTGKNAQAILARHAMETVPNITIVRNTVPPEVEDTIFASLGKVPADRPQTAAEFIELLGGSISATGTRVGALRQTGSRRQQTLRMSGHRPRANPWRRRAPFLAGGMVVLVGGLWLGAKLMGNGGAGTGALATGPRASRIAVTYFDARGDTALTSVADQLTEALIRSLAGVSSLDVVSQNGVAPLRGVSADSVSRALQVGTVVEGSIEAVGDQVRVRTQLRDARGNDLGKSSELTISKDQLFVAEDSVAEVVARTLRARLGTEFTLRERQAGTRNQAAWNLLSRAERDRKEAEALAREDPEKAMEGLFLADSMLMQAHDADQKWIEPLLLRGRIAVLQAQLAETEPERGRWIDSALVRANAAIALVPNEIALALGGRSLAQPDSARVARALELRGTILYADWRLDREADPAARTSLLRNAQRDLEAAVQVDPSRASAFAMLSSLYYDTKDAYAALNMARNAYRADAYLAASDRILMRLFWTSYDTGQFDEAEKWCATGESRFPSDYRFTACHLWLMLADSVSSKDISRAWSLVARWDSLAPPADRAFEGHLAQFVAAGVIGRAGRLKGPASLRDSANRVLLRARADASVDPHQELAGYEAIMRVQMGDLSTAIDLLKRYVALNPDHSFEIGGRLHWWWTDLKDQPGFQAVMGRKSR